MTTKIDTSKVLTDKDIDELMDDWFERDGETFTKIRKKGRIGWEETLEEGEAYSAYLLEAPTQEDLIKRAYTLAKETLVVMDPPFKVGVKITTGDSSGTDGRVVSISTKMFDDPELSVGEKLDAFLGTTVHEGCHLLYTDLSWLKKITNKVIFRIWNIIEDERIEQLCGEHKPGLANFLEKSKYYWFDQYYLDYIIPMEKEHPEKITPFIRIMNCFLHIIRYPKYLNEDEVVEFGHYLIEVKKVILPYPITTEQVVKAAYRVFDIIRDFYEKEERERAEAEGTGESEAEIMEKALKKLMEDGEAADGGLSKIAGVPVSVPVSEGGGGGLKGEDLAGAVGGDHELLGEICEGRVEVGSAEDSFFSKEPDNQRMYMESVSRIKPYVPAIAKIMKGHCKGYKLIHRSMRSGVLDTNKLAEAYQGVSTVYMREGEVKTDKVAVCVLIDESGSMGGDRIRAARDTAILINEAIGQVPNVELFIYGHSGDMKRPFSTEMYVYKEKGYNPRFSLGSCRARSQNRDGIAILETAKRVRKQTKNPVLFFILSDGAPCAGAYGGSSAMDHVKSCVTKTEQLGFNVIQVCINHSYDPGKMFRNYVILENMGTLAIELGKAIKKATMTAAKVHIT